jgi:hypothetical protein
MVPLKNTHGSDLPNLDALIRRVVYAGPVQWRPDFREERVSVTQSLLHLHSCLSFIPVSFDLPKHLQCKIGRNGLTLHYHLHFKRELHHEMSKNPLPFATSIQPTSSSPEYYPLATTTSLTESIACKSFLTPSSGSQYFLRKPVSHTPHLPLQTFNFPLTLSSSPSH